MNPSELPPKKDQPPVKQMTPLTPEEEAFAAAWLEEIEREAPKVSPEEGELKVKEFLDLVTAFETTHPLAELYAVTLLSVEEALKDPVRGAAKRDLAPIEATLKFLKERTSISPERYAEFQARYKYLSRAVGILNSGKVIHTY